MPTREEMLDEAYRRDLLPADLKSAYEEAQKRGLVTAQGPGRLERVGQGLRDVSLGATQLLSHAIGEENFRGLDKWAKQFLQSDLPDLPEGGIDQVVREREAAIQKGRGADAGSTDWYRVAGSALPLLPLGGELAAARPLLAATGLGGLGGALEPVVAPEGEFAQQKLQQTGFGAATGLGLGVGGKVAGVGMRNVGSRLAEKFPDSMKFLGRRKLQERIREDKKFNPDLNQTRLAELVNEANAKGIPMTLADFAGPNTQALIGNITRMSGPARSHMRQFLEERDKGEAQYLTQMVRRYIHGLHSGGNSTAYETAEKLIADRSANAAPLYRKVAELQGIWSPRLESLLEDPILQQALKPGFEFERIMARVEGRDFNPADLGLIIDKDGNIPMPKMPAMRVLDMVKKGLDALVEGERNGVTGKLTQRGYAINRLRDVYLSEIDSLDKSGVYRAAREAWGGPSASLDALKFGRGVFGSHPEEFAAEFNRLSPGDKDFARVGVADSAIEKILKVGLHGDEAKALVRSPWVRQQLKPVFRNEADYEGFMQEIDYAIKRFETKRGLIGGSQTAERRAEDQGAQVQHGWAAASIAHNLSSGNYLGAVRDLYRWYRDVGFQPDPEMNEAIAKVVLSPKLPKGFRTPKATNYGDVPSAALQRILAQVGAPALGEAQAQP